MRDRLSEALIANHAFLMALPEAARKKVREALSEIGEEVLEAQQAAAPVYSGEPRKGVIPGLLKQSLSVAQAVDLLRVRIGYPGLKGKRSKLFYAVIMEYGRQARVVPMRRLKQGARSEWRKRRAEGTARRAFKPDDLLSRARTMRVGAIAPRPFVHLEDRFYAVVDRHLEGLMDAITAEAGANG